MSADRRRAHALHEAIGESNRWRRLAMYSFDSIATVFLKRNGDLIYDSQRPIFDTTS
jgi:hypothetical protein